MIDRLWRLPRDLVSDGYDEALQILASQVPLEIREYPSGTECFTWIVPEKWSCHDAYLETIGGKRIFSYSDNPLHVVSYSMPFEGKVRRDELFEHLHVHPKLDAAVPFVFRYYQREWGLCCSARTRETLTDADYNVVIRTEFEKGTLKVGEVVVPGRSEECFILCAHLCHPGMVNDGLSGVVVGVDVMRKLIQKDPLRYTYRFIIVPETIGSAAYLSHHERLIPLMKGGLFLEMLGTRHPHALQLSYFEDSEMDLCTRRVVEETDPNAWVDGFMKIVLNDERMFNAQGIRVPMLSLSRATPKTDSDFPFREYHSSFDTPDAVSFENLRDSSRLVMKILHAIDQNRVPVPTFKGEVFWSRYKRINYKKMFPLLQGITYYIDGNRRMAEICQRTGFGFDTVSAFLQILEREDLIRWRD